MATTDHGRRMTVQRDASYPARPEPDEFLPYFGRYIDLVPDGDLLTILERQVDDVCSALEAVDPVAAATRPVAGEWSPLDIAVHLADTERVLAYRAFTFARHDGAELPGVEFEEFAEEAAANQRPVRDVVAELRAVRATSVALLRSLPADAWTHRGIASGSQISVRALAYVIAGHELHHLSDLRAASSPER